MWNLRGQKLASGNVHKGKAHILIPLHYRRQEVVAGLVQHGGLDYRSRGHHPGDGSFHQTPGKFGVLHLVADGHLMPRPDEPGEVGIEGMIRDPCQRDLLSLVVFLPGGEGDVQIAGNDDCIVGKGLVKVAHPK
ncbi:MAG: hypothetical protein A4E43_01257 [Methanosaeta sp. PtaB.Bin005]|nr:MAG: hypothetical protein A4E43_01257 [Methanosaeta sp. PtaB.Bin005]